MTTRSGSVTEAPGPPDRSGLPRLDAGVIVRVRRLEDPWLRRYSNRLGVVVVDDEADVEVRFPGGGRQFFLHREIEPVDESVAAHIAGHADMPAGVNGTHLKAERVRAGVAQGALASVLGVSQARLSVLERQAKVRPAIAARYLAGLRHHDLTPAAMPGGVRLRPAPLGGGAARPESAR